MISDELRASRAVAGRIGAAVRRSRHDPREWMQTPLAAYRARFRPTDPTLTPAEVEARTQAALRAHMLKLCLASAKARGKRLADKRAKAAKIVKIAGRNGGRDDEDD